MKNRHKIFLAVVIIVVATSFVLGVFGFVLGVREAGRNDVSVETVEAFQNELFVRGVEVVGHPIEGFDAFLLMEAFPGLEEADFDGVATGAIGREGVYSYVDNELVWERTESQPVTSAERTVSYQGYETLMENISGRINVSVSGTKDVMGLVDRLQSAGVDASDNVITSFERCAEVYPVMESYPEQCETPDGTRFVRKLPEGELANVISSTTMQGRLVCLPHWDTSGPQTLECAFGLQNDAGSYYALTASDSSTLSIGAIPTDTRVKVEGVLIPGSVDKYQSIGTIEVESINSL